MNIAFDIIIQMCQHEYCFWFRRRYEKAKRGILQQSIDQRLPVIVERKHTYVIVQFVCRLNLTQQPRHENGASTVLWILLTMTTHRTSDCSFHENERSADSLFCFDRECHLNDTTTKTQRRFLHVDVATAVLQILLTMTTHHNIWLQRR